MSEPITDPRIELRRPRVFALIDDERDLGLVTIGATLGDVIALSVTSKSGSTPLPRALGLGATRALEIVEASIEEVDYLALAHVLACAVRHLCDVASGLPVIVLAGDRGRGAIGPAVAERLALPPLGAVASIEAQQDRLVIERHTATRRQRYRGSPPVVLACFLPAVPAGESAPAGEVETLALDTLQITLPELRYRRRFRPDAVPAIEGRALRLGSPDRLTERLERDGVWKKA